MNIIYKKSLEISILIISVGLSVSWIIEALGCVK